MHKKTWQNMLIMNIDTENRIVYPQVVKQSCATMMRNLEKLVI